MRLSARIRTALIVGLAVVAGVVAWLVLKDGKGDRAKGAKSGLGPVIVARSDLARKAAASVPVYWVGAIPARRYELTKTRLGRVYVRYLPAGAPAGDPRRFLTVATYPAGNAYGALRVAAKRKGAHKKSLPNGGLAVVNPHGTTSAYVSFPGAPYQIEIYDPIPDNAKTLAFTGHLQRVP